MVGCLFQLLLAAQRFRGARGGSVTRVVGIAGELIQFLTRFRYLILVADPNDPALRLLIQLCVDVQSQEIVGQSLGRVGAGQSGELSHRCRPQGERTGFMLWQEDGIAHITEDLAESRT